MNTPEDSATKSKELLKKAAAAAEVLLEKAAAAAEALRNKASEASGVLYHNAAEAEEGLRSNSIEAADVLLSDASKASKTLDVESSDAAQLLLRTAAEDAVTAEANENVEADVTKAAETASVLIYEAAEKAKISIAEAVAIAVKILGDAAFATEVVRHKAVKNYLAELRNEAETTLAEISSEADIILMAMGSERLVHEVHVQNIELERQNLELQESSAEVEKRREYLADFYDSSPTGFISTDRNGVISDTNSTCAQLLGRKRSQLTGLMFSSFVVIADLPVFNNFLRQLFENGPRQTCILSLDSTGQTPVFVQIIGALSPDKQSCRAVLIDLTEQRQMEEQLRQKYKMEAVGVLAGGMAHNFNNNLSIILGNIELSKTKLSLNPEIEEFLDDAKIAVLRSRDLVKQITSYSRQSRHNKSYVQFSLLFNETLKLLCATIPSTVNLQKKIRDDCQSIIIHADASQLQECLINLCNNAMQAMDENGYLTISLGTEDLEGKDIPALYDALPGRYAKLSITDTGCGMSADTVDKIFDLFYTTKPVDEGAGVGLSTVQGVVKHHGGLIKVISTLGEGTTFELYFPVMEQPKTLEPKAANDDQPGGTERILLIDDDKRLAELGRLMLTGKGYQVTMMTDSQEALKLFVANTDHFDLVITDQTMPRLTGKELIQKLKQITPDIPTIIYTGFSAKIDETEALEIGADAFLMKPVELPVLLQTVRQVLDSGKI